MTRSVLVRSLAHMRTTGSKANHPSDAAMHMPHARDSAAYTPRPLPQTSTCN